MEDLGENSVTKRFFWLVDVFGEIRSKHLQPEILKVLCEPLYRKVKKIKEFRSLWLATGCRITFVESAFYYTVRRIRVNRESVESGRMCL